MAPSAPAEPAAVPAPFRREHDALGEVNVPRAAYWGAQTQRSLNHFALSGERASPSLVEAYGRLKAAMAAANRELGALPVPVARAIERAALEVAAHQWDAQFPVDVYQAGAGVSFHMNVNEVIANRAGELLGQPRGTYRRVHPNDHVNRSQSTNDTYPTALRIALRLEFDRLLPALKAAAAAWRRQARACATVVKAGRTHLQDAVPVTLGQEFAAYAATLLACHAALAAAADGLLELGLGGSAAGTGLNVPPRLVPLALRRLRAQTGHRWRQAANLHAAMQSQLPVAAASAAMRNLALELIRIANDLRLLASGPATGLDEIDLPALQPGSSIMPGKVNPVMPEMLAMACFQVVGNDTAVALAVQAGQLELNVMMPAMAYAALRSASLLTAALSAFTRDCVLGLRPHRRRCAAFAAATPAAATALNPMLGYSRTAALVQQAVRERRPVAAVVEQSGLLPKGAARRLLNPARLASGR